MPTPRAVRNAMASSPKESSSLTKLVREAFYDAFRDLQRDPAVKLSAWGRQNPTEFYKLVARLVPQEITGADGGPVAVFMTDVLSEASEIRRRRIT